MKNRLTILGLVSVACLFSYFTARTDSREDQIRQNRKIEATLRKYSEDLDHPDAAAKDDRIRAAKDWINTELARRVPHLLERKWYVSLPGWLHDPQSLNAQLEETIRELNWK